MRRRRWTSVVALAAAGVLVMAACGGDDDTSGTEAPAGTEGTSAPSGTEPTEGTEAPTGTEATEGTESAGSEAWAVDTSDCVDEAAANAPIEGTIKVGSVMPLSGGVAAIAFAPVKTGYEAYVEYANANEIIPGYTIELTIGDDQYNKDLTPGVVDKLLDDGVDLISGIIGTADNLAVRDTLNEECVPQLLAITGSPDWGDVADYPWTTGRLAPYDTEAKIFAVGMQEQFPEGATVALFTVNSEFGDFYVDAFNEVAADYGLDVVAQQTIEVTDEAPPTAQLNAIAAKTPDAILAVPLGGQCPTFLSALANTKAATPGWDPKVFITSTCASALILGSAGDAADGVYTAQDLKDVNDPAVQSEPGVVDYVQFMNERGSSADVTTGTQGWVTAELMVAILKQAAESPDGLTRASIIDAARNFEYTSVLARDGVVYKMEGEQDPFLTESMQVLQFDVATQTWSPVGDLVTKFES